MPISKASPVLFYEKPKVPVQDRDYQFLIHHLKNTQKQLFVLPYIIGQVFFAAAERENFIQHKIV